MGEAGQTDDDLIPGLGRTAGYRRGSRGRTLAGEERPISAPDQYHKPHDMSLFYGHLGSGDHPLFLYFFFRFVGVGALQVVMFLRYRGQPTWAYGRSSSYRLSCRR